MPRLSSPGPEPTRYNWAEWADGRWREFDHGTDYTVSTKSFVLAARGWGTRNGFNVTSRTTRRGCKIRFTPIAP